MKASLDDFSDLSSYTRNELTVMNQILIAILHSSDFDSLLSSIFNSLSWEIDLHCICVYSVIERSHDLKKVSTYGKTISYLPDLIEHSSDLCKFITNNKCALSITNELQLSLFEDDPACLYQPLLVDYKLIGAIVCIFKAGNPNLLKAILAQSASALELLYKADSVTNALSMRAHFKEDNAISESLNSYNKNKTASFHITIREIEVLKLLSLGFSNKEISEKLFISSSTCKHHVQSILEKLEVHSRAAAVAFFHSHQKELCKD